MDNVLEAFVTTVKAEKQMRDLSIDLPDLSIQYESMLTYLKQHDFILMDIRNALEDAHVSEVDFQMDWIADTWRHINLFKYKVSVARAVWATDRASAEALAVEMLEPSDFAKTNLSVEAEEIGK